MLLDELVDTELDEVVSLIEVDELLSEIELELDEELSLTELLELVSLTELELLLELSDWLLLLELDVSDALVLELDSDTLEDELELV